MRKIRFSAIFLAAILLLTSSGLAQGDKLPPLSIKQYKLKNGLTVLLHDDRSTPVVAVGVFYHVGSKNEAPGRTGFAHLFEHMMFQGSKNYSSDYLSAVNEMGASVNGTTNEDRTWYYETVPSNFLERALYLEADRMGGLLDAMDQAKLDNQRDVVKNERRRGVDNVPYGTMTERIREIIFPEGHPYHWDVIGSMDDLSAASLEDVKSFFRQYYVPNNTVLVVSGDFNETQARTWVQKYFGPIKAGQPIVRPNPAQPQLTGIVRKQYEDPFARSPRVSLVWPGVRSDAPDDAALSILGSILSGGRGSRLQDNLVYKNELVTNVGAGSNTWEVGGQFQISATARPGKSIDDIEREINTEIERVKRDGVTAAEVKRAVTQRDAQGIYGLQTVLGKASRMASYAAFLGKPDNFQADLDRIRKVTPEDVKRVANQYLNANHVVMTYVPAKNPPPPGRADAPTTTESKKADPALNAKQRAMLPKPGPNPKLTLPAIQKTQLSNGLNLWVVQQHELPIVSMNLVLNVGGTNDTAGKGGLASMTAGLLNQGTKSRTPLEISNGLQSIGSSVNANAGWDSTTVSMQTLTKNLDESLGYFSDIVMNPAFSDSEFRSSKTRLANGFAQRKTNATTLGGIVYDKVLYGDQMYGRPLSGDEKSVQAIGRDDVEKFYNSFYRPNNGDLIVVGDVQMADIKARLEKAFASWKPGDVKTAPSVEQRMVAKPAIYVVDKPGSVQSYVAVGQVGVARTNPDYYALQVMNSILGAGSSGRIFMNLREDKGYTYGAYSSFSYRRGEGPFTASGEIQTVSTTGAVREFLNELNGIRGKRPVTAAELEANKQALIRRFPANFETVGGVSGQLSNLVTYGLPDSYFNDYISKINAVTIADVNRVANKYLDPSKMAILVVGDRKVVEPELKTLGWSMVYLDSDGNVITQ